MLRCYRAKETREFQMKDLEVVNDSVENLEKRRFSVVSVMESVEVI